MIESSAENMNKFTLILSIALTVVFGSVTSANNSKFDLTAHYQDWGVFSTKDPEVCWILSTPLKTENTRGGKPVEVNRGDIILFVTYVPDNDVTGEVSFVGGYTFMEDTYIELQIGAQNYKLVPHKGSAWAPSSEVDRKIRVSMTRGETAIIKAMSDKGTLTKDTFSLRGFTAALKDAKKRCGV